MKRLIVFILCLLTHWICTSQITGISTEQKYNLVEALTRYDALKVEFALVNKKLSLSEMELKLREQEIKLLDNQLENKDMIIKSQKEIIDLKTIQLKKKNNWIKPTAIGIGVGFIVSLILVK